MSSMICLVPVSVIVIFPASDTTTTPIGNMAATAHKTKHQDSHSDKKLDKREPTVTGQSFRALLTRFSINY